jgi:hypothetical protein
VWGGLQGAKKAGSQVSYLAPRFFGAAAIELNGEGAAATELLGPRKEGRKDGRKAGRKDGWMDRRKDRRKEGRKGEGGRKGGRKEGKVKKHEVRKQNEGKERKKKRKEGRKEGRKDLGTMCRRPKRGKGKDDNALQLQLPKREHK